MRERKLPGKPGPRAEALAEFQAQRAKVRPERRLLWDLVMPPPEEVFRWRVQLDCGCIHERLSRRDQTHPSEWHEHDVITQRRLPKGQANCRHADDVWSEYREIASWGDAPKVHEFGADPIEPRDGVDPGTWAEIRKDEPHKAAFWPVELSCGHPADVVMSDLGWKPGDAPRLVSEERAAEMLAEFDEDPTMFDEPRQPGSREHMRRMIELRWPDPQPEQECRICPHARTIVAFERVGWLVPPPEPETTKRGESKAMLQRQLQHAEREAERIQKQLAQCADLQVYSTELEGAVPLSVPLASTATPASLRRPHRLRRPRRRQRLGPCPRPPRRRAGPQGHAPGRPPVDRRAPPVLPPPRRGPRRHRWSAARLWRGP